MVGHKTHLVSANLAFFVNEDRKSSNYIISGSTIFGITSRAKRCYGYSGRASLRIGLCSHMKISPSNQELPWDRRGRDYPSRIMPSLRALAQPTGRRDYDLGALQNDHATFIQFDNC